MIATIHQPQYLPWLGYFDKADQADIFILLDNVQFKKNEWQNRNRIRTAQGWQWLTVPVLHDFGQKINEVKINNNQDWRKAHLKSISLNYSKAPFFDDYIDFFESTYDKEWELLSEINVYFFKKIIELLGITTKIVMASQYQSSDDSTQRLIDLCKEFDADTYIAGRDGNKYMDFDKFSQNAIKVRIQDFQHPQYSQLWTNQGDEGFISHTSVIDLLFNHGVKSLDIIRQQEKV